MLPRQSREPRLKFLAAKGVPPSCHDRLGLWSMSWCIALPATRRAVTFARILVLIFKRPSENVVYLRNTVYRVLYSVQHTLNDTRIKPRKTNFPLLKSARVSASGTFSIFRTR